ncbi:MAG TPA: SdrD B-like domain-containing protein, partial [Candidatus Dojkabacteria bacterium]|nr:SdrD B-like domain-containing protein [Candidatus Dojkabacteria bacterium]
DITITKKTNDDDAQTAPGPSIYVGESVTWTYIVQNTGNVPLNSIVVTDDIEGVITCPKTSLSPGDHMVCTKVGTAKAGQYENYGSVTASHSTGSVNDSDVSHYFGLSKGYLKVQKTTIPKGSQQEFSIMASGNGTITGGGAGIVSDAVDKIYEVTAGTYSVSETVPTNWEITKNTCQNVEVANGQTATCEIENTYMYAKLTVIKDVKNDNGGTKKVSDFKLYVNGTEVESGDKNDYPINTLLSLTEDNLSGYQASAWGGDCSEDGKITLKPGDDKTCTITNDDIQPKLTVNKVVVGGDKKIVDFPLYVGAIQVESGVENGFDAGNYLISETNQAGYTASYSGACDVQGNVSLAIGDVKSCTITNTRDTGSLNVHKLTDTDADGIFESSDVASNLLGFRWGIGATTDQSFNTAMTGLETGGYDVYENTVTGYHFYSWYNAADQSKSCTDPDGLTLPATINVEKGKTTNIVLCNARDTGSLKVKKVVDDNTDLSLWEFKLNDGKPVKADSNGLVDFGPQLTGSGYVITESGPSGYQLGSITGDNCVQNTDNTASATVVKDGTMCIFNNLVNRASITVIKNAVEDSNVVFDFNLTGGVSRTFQLEDDGDENDGAPSQWSISSLLPGSFTLSEILTNAEWKLTDLTCSSSLQKIQDLDNSVTFTLSPGESMICTFTNTQLGKVKALKYNDLNGNGDYSQDEGAFLGGWEMSLYSGFDCLGAPLDVELTQAGGPAVFAGLEPGDYSVKETMQSDWMATNGECRNYTITAGQQKSEKFGNFNLFNIEGYKFEDRDKDGIFDNNELGIANWKISLFLWNEQNQEFDLKAERITKSGGWYRFDNIGPGLYKVEEETKTGWQAITSTFHTFTATSGQDKNYDFGNISQGKIIVDKITIPANDPKKFDFELIDIATGQTTPFKLTDQENPWEMDVQQGVYSVDELLPSGWHKNWHCISSNGNDERNLSINIEPGETVTCTFTNTKLGSIKVIKDAKPNSNELFDFTFTTGTIHDFTLQDNSNNHDGHKNWELIEDLPSMTYTLMEKPEQDWELINIRCDSNYTKPFNVDGQSVVIRLQPGEDMVCTFTNEKYSELTVFKYNDLKGDGDYDRFEDQPIENWGMQLYSGSYCRNANKIGSMVYTDADGKYTFEGLLHGGYSVKEASDPAWKNTTDKCQNIELDYGDSEELKFGNFELGKIEGYKYDDINQDGDWDSNEPEVAGWRITLLRYGIYQDHVYTDANGYYSFGPLGPGLYTVIEESRLLSGWKHINPVTGMYTMQRLESGETKRLDFGNHSFAIIKLDKDTLPGRTGEEFTLNILQDGVEIKEHDLRDRDIPTMDSVSTRFTYSVTEDPKDGWELTDLQCRSCSGEIKDPTGFDVKPGEIVTCEFTNTLLGKIKAVKYSDDNGNGIFEPGDGEEKLSGWGMNLYNTDNAYTQGKATDAMGEAFFNDLQMGHYVLSEDQQDGWELTGIYCENNNPIRMISGSSDPQTAMPLDAEHIDVYPGLDYTCYVGNQELGDVVVTKFNDVNGDGLWQKGDEEEMEDEGFSLNYMVEDYREEVLEGWMIHMDVITDNVNDDSTHFEPNVLMSKYSEETDANGEAFFEDMPIAKYKLYETQQEGWTMTNIYCERDEEVVLFSTAALLEPIEDRDYLELELQAGDSYHCYIGNQISELNIDKTNDASGPLSIGDTATFTIMLSIPELTSEGFTPAMLDDLMVKDLFSKGFEYIAGTNRVWVNGVEIVAPIPTYNSPGTWDLSSLLL